MPALPGASGRGFLYGLVADETSRSNVALVSSDQSQYVELRLQVHDGDAGGVPKGGPIRVRLEGTGWQQVEDVLRKAGVRNGWVEITWAGGIASWSAYGVINDGGSPGERTGDGAYVPLLVVRGP